VSAHADRIDRLRHALRQQALETFLVTDVANVTYLTGFRGDSSWLLVSQEHLWFVTDSRFTEQAQSEAAGCAVIERKDPLAKETAKVLKAAGTKSLGFEEQSLTCATHRELCESLDGLAPLATKGTVETLRQVKDEGEIERIRAAVATADAAFAEVRGQIRPGLTERDVASRLEFAMQQHGARKPSFDSIIAARARASLPHAESTGAVIRPGDPVLVDWGATRDLYCSDATRMVFLAPPDAEWRKIYGIVRTAQERGIAAIRAGAAIRDVDTAARKTIADAGYGERFGHGLGHGVGLRVHEDPRLHAKAEEKDVLLEGMVITVEPGIYLPGWGGVRLEDLVVVRRDGPEILTGTPKDLDSAILG
jgi:Xaa-Pro aminopeptidase